MGSYVEQVEGFYQVAVSNGICEDIYVFYLVPTVQSEICNEI